MTLVKKLGSLFFQFVYWIFKETGINGVLVIAILIEIPILLFYYSDSSSFYTISKNYRIQDIIDYKEISIDELPAAKKEYASDSDHYFHTIIQIDNYYYAETHIPILSAVDSDGDSLYFLDYDYYDDLEDNLPIYKNPNLHSVIPAGASAYVTYLLEIPDYNIDTTDSITVYSADHLPYNSEEKEYNTGRRLTAPFTP